jgi:hypothetical protein
MSNVKVQSSNEVQSSNDKLGKMKNGLTLSHLAFLWHLDFGI